MFSAQLSCLAKSVQRPIHEIQVLGTNDRKVPKTGARGLCPPTPGRFAPRQNSPDSAPSEPLLMTTLLTGEIENFHDTVCLFVSRPPGRNQITSTRLPCRDCPERRGGVGGGGGDRRGGGGGERYNPY